MTGLWAFEEHLAYQKYQGPPIVVRWSYGLFNVLKTLDGAVIFWFDHFLDSGAEIFQMFHCFSGKFKKSKRHSEINWPLE